MTAKVCKDSFRPDPASVVRVHQGTAWYGMAVGLCALGHLPESRGAGATARQVISSRFVLHYQQIRTYLRACLSAKGRFRPARLLVWCRSARATGSLLLTPPCLTRARGFKCDTSQPARPVHPILGRVWRRGWISWCCQGRTHGVRRGAFLPSPFRRAPLLLRPRSRHRSALPTSGAVQQEAPAWPVPISPFESAGLFRLASYHPKVAADFF